MIQTHRNTISRAVTRRPSPIPPGGAGKTEQAVRAELMRLQARYDSGAPQAIFSVIRSLETELAWIEHGKRRSL
jgi:hypothetical protein